MSKGLILMGKSLIVGVGFLAMASAAQAEPVALTAQQMDGITAGSYGRGWGNVNFTIVNQIAIPIAISIVVCPNCSPTNINSSALASASNISFTSQLAGR